MGDEMKETSYIEVKLYELAEHSWKDAPPHRDYLKPKHQHLFEIKVRMSVSHGEREIEFHDLRSVIEKILNRTSLNNSCENNAKSIFKSLKGVYGPHRKISVMFAEEGGLVGKYGNVVV